ncbi:DUF3182 family protein [soil metagenome]
MRTSTTPGLVLVHGSNAAAVPFGHESVTHANLARKLAAIKDMEFGGAFDSSASYDRPIYLVPSDTLTTEEAHTQFGVRVENDIFGGVVPHAFAATKTITHCLPEASSLAPVGWSPEFCQSVCGVVLPGYSAFTARDALIGGLRLLKGGVIRLKLAEGIGGSGQWLIKDAGELGARLQLLETEGRLRKGLVLERNLNDATTLSVGQVIVDNLVATYYGTQREVVNNHGHRVYGGSKLTVVRGGCSELLALDLPANVRSGIEQAWAYDTAARVCFRGSFMSRRNYDIAQGVDDAGEWRSGVLEQSWRVGGASGAEVAALEAFKSDPALQLVRASTTELYGHDVVVPGGAFTYFSGVDERVGALTKYSQID